MRCLLFFFPNLLFHSPPQGPAFAHSPYTIIIPRSSPTGSSTQRPRIHRPPQRPDKRHIASCETTVAPFPPAARPSVFPGPRSKIPGLPVPQFSVTTGLSGLFVQTHDNLVRLGLLSSKQLFWPPHSVVASVRNRPNLFPRPPAQTPDS
ncbi:hypothetical protein TgHK011_007434 [Trichoderma gracile]|nr:hypothetical protein TgHK011_007434 [Trichoderma gracile]